MLRASAGSIRFTSIYGTPADLPASAAPFAYLLEIDEVKIMLDCGWDDRFDTSYLNKLLPYVTTVDAVLLSSPEMNSCGALPFVLEHLRPEAFVVAAGSTSKIGIHGVLHPFLSQFPNTNTFMLEDGREFVLSVDKIYSAFRSVREPYGGKVVVESKGVEVECSAIFAGRMLGGYSWMIKYQIDELLYCPDFSVKPSHALKRFNVPTTANVVLLESFPFSRTSASTTKKYEEQLQSLFRDIQHTFRSGGDVLIPVNVPGRGLEVVNTIMQLLTEKGGERYKVILAALQAQELMDKAGTMTEALQDDVILSDHPLFANVIACRTAQDVLAIPGPKVCIADGATLDFGVAAELLEYFLPSSSQGGSHLIIFPEAPYTGTNAYAIAECSQHEELSYTVMKRSKLSKEELEEYYVRLEREMEEKRQQLEDTGVFAVELGDNEEESEEEDEGSAAAAAAANPGKGRGNITEVERKQNTAGLVLPPYMQFESKYLNFPCLETTNTLNAALVKGENIAYGLPVSDEEQLVIQKRAPTRNYSDEGPESLQIRNDAQLEANTPSKVFASSYRLPRSCRVVHSDLSGLPDAVTVKTLLKSKLTFAKKIVAIRGTPEDWRLLAHFGRAERSLKCGENVFMPQGAGIPLELATQVFSYLVQLDPKVAQTLPNNLRRVRETNARGWWEVGWVEGELRSSHHVEGDKDEPERQRARVDGKGMLTISALNGQKMQACAEQRERDGLQRGSYFVGDVELHRLRDTTRRETGLLSEFHKKAPMLVFDDGVCVRKGTDGNMTVASIASPSMFTVRQSVYRQFSQIL